MFTVSLYIGYQLDRPEKAVELLEFFNEQGGVFAPVRYGPREPLKKVFDPDDLGEPAQLLSRSPEHSAGSIWLKGAKHRSLAWIKWSAGDVSSWDMFLDDKFFARPAQTAQFIEFLAELCRRFPVLYGGAAPSEDWDAKHWKVERGPTGGEALRKMGLELDECLPGVYWATIFGAKCVKTLGRAKIEGLDAHRIVDLGPGGLLAVLREHPFKPERDERLRQDKMAMRALGERYFFSIDDPAKGCKAIPGVTRGKAKSTTEEQPAQAGGGPITEQELEELDVPDPDGGEYADPRDLTHALPVILHMDVKEVHDYTRESLGAIDAYFAQHPPRREYYDETLTRELIPAIGAYLGEVLVRREGAEWQVRQPMLKSVVAINGSEVNPFREAYRVVYKGASLEEIYDQSARGRGGF